MDPSALVDPILIRPFDETGDRGELIPPVSSRWLSQCKGVLTGDGLESNWFNSSLPSASTINPLSSGSVGLKLRKPAFVTEGKHKAKTAMITFIQ